MNLMYQCEICSSCYFDKDAAIACEAQGRAVAKYKVGDTVYVRQKYPCSYKKPYVKRTIAKVKLGKHEARYVIDKTVETASGSYMIGLEFEYMEGESGYYYARDNDLYSIGDESPSMGEKLTLDMVDLDT